MRILLAEDHDLLRGTIENDLRRDGHSVTAVSNGRLLLDELHTSDEYDLVITDDHMPPELSGIQVLRELRADDRHKDIPIIVYAWDLDDDPVREIESLRGTYVDKSGEPEFLRQAIAATSS